MIDRASDAPTLLVVDDEDTREVLAELLVHEGYRVLTARDGVEARSRLAEGDGRAVDLVLLDIVMPRTSGLDLLTELRRQHSPHRLPVIMMSAKDQSADVVEALEKGANDYVTKPLDLPVLLARLQAQLRLRTAATPPPSPTVEIPVPGAVLGGRYRLAEKLGEGSFGFVFRGRDEESGRAVAIKVLRAGLGPSAEAVERLNREGLAGRKLRHPHAVQVFDFRTTQDGTAYLVMELLEGRSLADLLQVEGPQSPARCVELMLPVCVLLADAHAMGIVHRDVKPANIFLHRGDSGEVVKVLDFGIARPPSDLSLQKLTADGSLLGSPAYMAPERLRSEPFDGRADVYSLGVTIFETLTGRLPFTARHDEPLSVVAMHLGEPPPLLRSVRPDLPESLERAVAASLEKDPARRPWAAELGRALAEAVGTALPPSLQPDHLRTLRF